jgi:hypothetical protein
MTPEQQAKLFQDFTQADFADRAPLWRNGTPLAQARMHDGRRRDRDERAGQGLGVYGALAGRHGYTLTPNTHKRFGHIFFVPDRAMEAWYHLPLHE